MELLVGFKKWPEGDKTSKLFFAKNYLFGSHLTEKKLYTEFIFKTSAGPLMRPCFGPLYYYYFNHVISLGPLNALIRKNEKK